MTWVQPFGDPNPDWGQQWWTTPHTGSSVIYYTQPSVETMPKITAFKGAVKDVAALPKTAKHGDAYYVEKLDTLVVRQTEGWFHLDRK